MKSYQRKYLFSEFWDMSDTNIKMTESFRVKYPWLWAINLLCDPIGSSTSLHFSVSVTVCSFKELWSLFKYVHIYIDVYTSRWRDKIRCPNYYISSLPSPSSRLKRLRTHIILDLLNISKLKWTSYLSSRIILISHFKRIFWLKYSWFTMLCWSGFSFFEMFYWKNTFYLALLNPFTSCANSIPVK